METERSFKEILMEIFPDRRVECIENIIQIVEENSDQQDYMLEEMINLLSESGESTLSGFQEEAAGYGHTNAGTGYYFNLLEKLFPNICPSLLRNFCTEKCQNRTSDDVDEIVGEFLEEATRFSVWKEPDILFPIQTILFNSETTEQLAGYLIPGNRSDSIFEQLVDMMPDADPDYLRNQAELLADSSDADLEDFIENAIKKNDYPTKKDYYKRQKNISEVKAYTTNFSIEEYLDVIPDPFKHFSSSNYKYALADNNVPEDETYGIKCLLNYFPYLREKDIRKIFNRFDKNIIKASDTLARIPRYFKTPRQHMIIDEECGNIQLLQELAFIEHKRELKTAMKMMDNLYRSARAEAEKYNLLETCQCCFFDGLLPEECYFCKKNCPFCKDCVAKGAEHVIGKGDLVFPCLSNCNSEFDISVLRMVLDKKLFEPLLVKIQIKEIKNANIHGLETCPFCDFSMILPDEDKILKCQNIECMEETCRECRHKSHVPLRCNEIEYDEDVRKRTYIENKMTEGLVRTCWKCQKSFLKESGCNKMTCPCGAKMCYHCGAANIGYEHFGEIAQNKCPLYTHNLDQFHAERVRNSARLAKAELGVNNNPHLLKIDPTAGLEEYFQTL